MKARVKATGEIVEVISKVITSFTGEHKLKYIDQDTGVSYFEEELFFPKDLVDDPDYWTRLEHTYAGMAMQGILANIDLLMSLAKKKADDYPAKYTVAKFAKDCAHALVEKMKEERK